MRRLTMIAAVFAAAILLGGVPIAGTSTSEYLVAVDNAQPLSNVAVHADRLGFSVRASYEDLHALRVIGPVAASQRLSGMDGVRYAEPVSHVTAAYTPADPLYGSESQYLTAAGAPAAWDITKGSRSIVVAVVDTGVDVLHPDLAPNIWVNPARSRTTAWMTTATAASMT